MKHVSPRKLCRAPRARRPRPLGVSLARYTSIAAVCGALLAGSAAPAAVVYLDNNGVMPGSGITGGSSILWDASATIWNDAPGTGTAALWMAGDTAAFAAGMDAGTPFTVTVSGAQSIGGLAFQIGGVSLAGTGSLLMAGNANFDVTANLTATVNTILDGASDLTKTGGGTLVLGGANTFSGRTLISAGTVSVASDGNLGAVAALTADSISFTGSSTLQFSGTGNTAINANRGITIGNSFTGTVQVVAAANTVTYGGLITGAAGTTFKKTGAGTLELQAASALAGALNVDGGTLKLSGSGTLAGTSGVTISNRGTLTLDNTATNLGDRTAGALASSGGTLNFIGNATATTETLGVLTLSPGALTINTTPGAGGSTLTIPTLTRSVAGGTLYLNGTGLGAAGNQVVLITAPALVNSILKYAVVSDGTVTRFATHGGNGTTLAPLTTGYQAAETAWTAATVNALPTADTTMTASRTAYSLTLGNAVNILTPTADRSLTLSGAVLQTGGSSLIAGNTTSGFDNILAWGANEALFITLGILQLDRGNTNTLTGTGGFTKSGAGTLILNGVSTLSGAFNVNEGILELRGATSLMTTAATINLNGATLRLSNDTGTAYTGNVLVNADSTIQVDRVTPAATATTHTIGTLSIGGGRTLSVASNDITTDIAYGLTAGVTQVTFGGATFNVSNNGNGLATMTLGTITSSGNTITKTGAGDLITNGAIGLGGGVVDVQGGRTGWSNNTAATVTAENSTIMGAGGIVKSGASTVNLTGSNTFMGGVTVSGGTLGFSTVSDNSGSPGSLGEGTNGITIGTATLSFTGGASQSTNRLITLSGGLPTTTGPGLASTINAGGTGGAVITFAGGIDAGTTASYLYLTGNATSSGAITGGFTQTGIAADLFVNSGTWALSGTPTVIADDLIVTGGTAVLNLNSTGVLGYTAGTSNGLYVRTDAVVNLNADDVNGVDDDGGLDFIFFDTATGTLKTNGFNITVPRLDIGGSGSLTANGIINGTGTLTVTTDFNLYIGSISANLAGAAAIEKLGNGTVTLSGDNSGLTLAASATRVDAGNLILDYTASNTTKLSAVNSLDMRGGALTINGSASADTSQSVLSLTLFSGGSSAITVNSGGTQSATLNLGAITRAAGQGTIRFRLPDSGAITTTTVNTNGILGAWATAIDSTGTYFAKNDGANNIVPLLPTTKNDVSTWAAGENLTDETTGFTGTRSSAIAINTLRFNAGGPSSVTIGDGLALGVTTGGILQTSKVTAGISLITGGRLTSGTGAELIFTTDSAQPLEVASTITGNATLTKNGVGTLRLSGTNNFTGATRLQTGTLQLSGGNAIGDTAAVTISAVQNSVLELLGNETIGTLSGGSNSTTTALSELRLNGNDLTVNQTSNGTYAGAISGTAASSLTKMGAGNFQLTTGANTFAGAITVNTGLFYLSVGTTMPNVPAYTVNKGGSFMIDDNGTTTSSARIADTATITLNSADGMWNGETRPSGLVIRRDQGSTITETVGVITLNSGASYAKLDSTVALAVGAIAADNIVRSNGATFDVRGTNLSATTGQRSQLRIVTAGNQTAFINAMVGGGSTTLGTKNISIVPWAIAEEITFAGSGGGVGDANMGNSLATYVSGGGFRALNLGTEYNTFAASAIATENIRESLAASLTGLSGKNINSLILNNSNTAASSLNVTGTGAGQALAVTSGTLLFTATAAITGTPAMGITLGGFDAGITVGSTNEYVVFVQNPTSVAAGGLVTATIASPLTSTADITKSGRGTLVLSGTNTAGGAARKTTINEGVLQIAGLANIGGNTGALVFAGGTLKLGAGFADDLSTRTISFLQAGGTLDTNGIDLTLAGSLGSGIGGFTKIGAGNLTLNGAAAYTGNTSLSAGTLTMGVAQAIGTGVLNVSGAATLAVGANNAIVAGLTVSNAVNVISGSGTLTVNGDATVNRGTIAPLLAGSMNLFKQTAAQIVTLSNPANTFTGYTQVQDGTLSIASLANAGVASSLGAPTGENAAIRLGNVATSGVLNYTGGLTSTDRMIVLPGTTGGGTIDNDGSGALTLAGNVTGTEFGTKALTLQGATIGFTNVVSGTISDGVGTVGVTKAEAGTWSLTGTNTFSGTTTLSAGTLIFSNNNNFGSATGTIAPFTFNGGTLQYAPTATNTDISGRTVTFTSATKIDTNGLDVTYANGVGNSGAGGLTKLGAGTLTLAGTNAFTGTTNVSAGKLLVTGSIAIGTGNLFVANVAGNAVLNIPTGGSVTVNMLQVGSTSGSFGALNLTGGAINMTQTETTPDGTESFGAGVGSYGAFNMSSGTMTTTRFMFGGVSGSTGIGGIGVGRITSGTVNTSGYIILARNAASTGVLTLDNGTINHNGAIQDVNIGYQGTGRAELNLLGGLLDNSGRNVKFGGGAWSGTGILNLNGGTLITNIFTTTGTSYLNFNGGTLTANLSSATFLPGLTAVNVNGAFGTNAGGAVFNTNSFDVTVLAPLLAPAGNGVSTLAVTDGGSGYLGAPYVSISGGTGATAIANMVDDGSGNGTFKVGSITVTNPGTGYAGTPAYTFNNGGATVAATPGAVTTAANTSGGLTKLGAGVLTLTGTNTFGGAVNVNGGTLAFSTSANLGDATKATNTIGLNGATLSYTGAGALDLGANRVLTLGGGSTLDVANAAATLTVSGGTAASSENLVKTGPGAVILAGTTDLSGGTTTVSAGLLRAGFGTAGTSAISVAAGAVLQNATPSATPLVLPNTGSLTFSAGADLTTASNLGFGLGATTASGITLTSGGALTINGSGTVFIDLLSLGVPLSPMTYNLLSVPGGGLLTGTGGAVDYALDDIAGGYTYTLNRTPTLISVTVGLFNGSLYWHGDLTGPAGSWTDYRSGDTNWRNAVTGGSDDGILPGGATTVIFSATEATGPAISTTLDGDVTIKHLQFTSNPAGVSSVTIAQGTGGALTIKPAVSTDGIDVGDNVGSVTISAPLVAGANQTWNVGTVGTPSLTVSGGLSGMGSITKTGAGALTVSAVNSTLGGDFIWNGGALTITPTGTGANTMVFNGVISGSGTGPLLKNGAGNLILNGANTYSGGTTLDGGTTILGHQQAFGMGTVTASTNAPTLQAGVDLTGASKVANAFVLDANLTVSGTHSLELGGSVTAINSNRSLTNSLTGSAVLTLSGGIILSDATAARNLTVNGTGSTIINGVVASGPVGGGWLVKGGTGTLTLGAANTYSGFTIIDQGSLALAAGVNQSMTNTFYFGSSGTATTAGTLDLSNASATFTTTMALWNQINSATATPAIIVGAGQSLNLNGNVLIGNNTAGSTTTLMTASGLGTINVTNAATNASFRLGGYTGTTAGQGNRASVDWSALAALNISLNTTTGTVAVSNNTSANTAGKYSTLLLPATTNITAKTLAVGDGSAYAGSGAGQINALKLGSLITTIKADAFNIGTGVRDFGSVSFNGTTGTLVVRNTAGTGRAALNIGTTGGGTGVATIAGDQNTFDVTGHSADLLLGAVVIGSQARGDAQISTFSFDQGTLDMTTLTLATRGAAALAGGHTTTSTVNLGGGTVTIGSGVLQMAQSTAAATVAPLTSTTTATINITGGTVNIGNTAGTSIAMASAVANTSATAALNLTGGATTLTGNITSAGGAGTTSATVTLNGGTLDMGGKSIGGATSVITFNAQKGTLKNLGQLNGGGALTKTGSASDTLTLSGTNGYTGATNVTAGKLIFASLDSNANALTIAASATAEVAATTQPATDATTKVLKTSALLLTGNATLNLTNNALIVEYLAGASSLTAINAAVTSGFNAGLWNGTGINSSTAGTDSSYGVPYLTALGVVDNAASNYTTFLGRPVIQNSVLVRYTLYGDANLDGLVDSSDYTLIDSAYLALQNSQTQAVNWLNGDFDYSGSVDGADYALIDTAYAFSHPGVGGAPEAAQHEAEFGSAYTNEVASLEAGNGPFSVPEPGSFAMLGAGGLLLGLRRRRTPRG